MKRRNIDTGTPWEAKVGYSRAVRIGPHVWVCGTMAADESGAIVGPGDAAAQTRAALEKIRRALESAGATLDDVVRTRMYVTDIDRQDEIGAVHRAFFGHVRPCATMVEITRLATPEALVEIEAEAYVDGSEIRAAD